MISDRIEKRILLKAPRARVWKALTTESEFGAWFGAEFIEGGFAENQRAKLRVTMKGYEHLEFSLTVVKMEPPAYFAWRWVPGAQPPEGEASTLVEFRLEDAEGGGTLFQMTESGFDRLSLAYRAKAYQENSGGWEYQTQSIRHHLEKG